MMTNRRTLARWLLCALATALTPMAMSQDKPAAAEDDPHLWLEEVQGDKALAWVEPGQVWVADRNFATTRWIFGVVAGGGHVAVRASPCVF